MRLKDSSGKLTKDGDITLTSGSDSLDITVDNNNTVIFSVQSSKNDTNSDLKYQLADARLTTHLIDYNNPHQNINYFIEQIVESPATGEVIYETVTPVSTTFKLNLASIECYVFPTIYNDTVLSVDITRNGESIFENIKITSSNATKFDSYSKCNFGRLVETEWFNDDLYTFYPSTLLQVVVSESYKVDKLLIRLIFW